MERFNFEELGNLAPKYRDFAAQFRRLDNMSAIEMGRMLLAAKDELGHRFFTPFVETELGRKMRTVQDWMGMARKLDKDADSALLEQMPLTVMRELLADDVPSRAKAAVIATYQADDRLTADEVQSIVTAAKEEDKQADMLAEGWLADALAEETTKHMRHRAVVHLLAGLEEEDRAAIITEASTIEPAEEPAEQLEAAQ